MDSVVLSCYHIYLLYMPCCLEIHQQAKSSVYLNFLHIVQERGAADFVLTLDKAFPENSLERDASKYGFQSSYYLYCQKANSVNSFLTCKVSKCQGIKTQCLHSFPTNLLLHMTSCLRSLIKNNNNFLWSATYLLPACQHEMPQICSCFVIIPICAETSDSHHASA